jgi:4-diphosphocytidyl-2-C-methyl-D-erythritol kinase
MIVYPKAKINLGLNIVLKRPDGFHNIETVFYAVPITDILEVLPTEDNRVTFSSSGISIDSKPDDNLCVKAYELIDKDYKLPGVKIHLHKRIPIGAGLGGGSSDAVYTLKVLNELFELKLIESQLLDYAKKLGSDCAFFVSEKPVYAYNKGDEFESVDISLKGKYFALVYPDLHVSTPLAYSLITPSIPTQNVKKIIGKGIDFWKENLVNDFELPIAQKYPVIDEIKKSLYESGAKYAAMSGSGSSVFGIFDEEPKTVVNKFSHFKKFVGQLSD